MAVQGDAALLLFCPLPDRQAQTEATWQWLARCLEAGFYQRLRSELQLGYAVFSGFRLINGHAGLLFGVQSPSATVAQVLGHIEAFLAGLDEALKDGEARARPCWHSCAAATRTRPSVPGTCTWPDARPTGPTASPMPSNRPAAMTCSPPWRPCSRPVAAGWRSPTLHAPTRAGTDTSSFPRPRHSLPIPTKAAVRPLPRSCRWPRPSVATCAPLPPRGGPHLPARAVQGPPKHRRNSAKAAYGGRSGVSIIASVTARASRPTQRRAPCNNKNVTIGFLPLALTTGLALAVMEQAKAEIVLYDKDDTTFSTDGYVNAFYVNSDVDREGEQFDRRQSRVKMGFAQLDRLQHGQAGG